MQKENLVKLLVDDFVKMFPESSRAERVHLNSTLNMMEVEDLELMASQVKKQETNTNQGDESC